MANPNYQLQVFVVGAGPTGLVAAAALAKLGVAVRIIDKNSSRSDKSKALGVQAGTLECLEHVFGSRLTEEMVSRGQKAHGAWIHIEEIRPIHIDLSLIPSPYNYILILEQSETEKFLEETLNSYSVQVERQTELIEIKDRGDHVLSKIKKVSGEIEEIRSDFVIGCDGAHSITRHQLGFQFKGGTYEGEFILGDVTLEWPWDYGSIRTFVSQRGVIASFPMKGEAKYRLILIPNDRSSRDESLEINLNEFRDIVSNLSHGQIKVQASDWLTRFRVHHRMVDHFQMGRVFLAGDAAHIHSPAGGQGMNTGIQDALNFAFKLSQVIQNKGSLDLLKSYERERIPIAKQVLRGTDLVFRLALLNQSKFVFFLRRRIIPLIVSSKFIQRKVVTAMSEIRVAREEIRRYGSNTPRYQRT